MACSQITIKMDPQLKCEIDALIEEKVEEAKQAFLLEINSCKLQCSCGAFDELEEKVKDQDGDDCS